MAQERKSRFRTKWAGGGNGVGYQVHDRITSVGSAQGNNVPDYAAIARASIDALNFNDDDVDDEEDIPLYIVDAAIEIAQRTHLPINLIIEGFTIQALPVLRDRLAEEIEVPAIGYTIVYLHSLLTDRV